ncbi:MAG: toll/interleukin-1 receptor domain-containing protein [Phycisphaerae bacterium]|nr:toll/interleukin-1 receptor domain-containing protein [Phycisphaerae bacterium]
MAEEEKPKGSGGDAPSRKAIPPLVFISHDGRDAELAEAFSKLLRSISAGMLKSFRSSDNKGREGIEFGDEWYKRLMEKLDSASDVVCLFTERSVARPWILFEAGVAKGKLNKPVLGLALGVSLNAITTGPGPFFQFQNSDDSEDSLAKLLKQLAERVPSLELDDDVVKAQVKVFKEKVDTLLSQLDDTPDEEDSASDSTAAKILEEMKAMLRDLPGRIENRVSEGPTTRRKRHRLHPVMFERMMSGPEDDMNPVGLLVMAGLVRDDLPWYYELAVETYRTVRSGTMHDAELLLSSLDRCEKMWMHGPLMEEIIDSREMDMMMHEFPHMLRHVLERTIDRKRRSPRKKI